MEEKPAVAEETILSVKEDAASPCTPAEALHDAVEVCPQEALPDEDEAWARAQHEEGASAHEFAHAMKMARKCDSQWEHMNGNDSLRQCVKCQLLVIKTQDLSEDGLSRLFNANEDFLLRCYTNPLSALLNARKGLFRRIDGSMTIGDCHKRRVPRPGTVSIFGAVPFVPLMALYLCVPGYIIPFLNHPIARLMVLAAIGWHALGCWLFSRTSHLLLQIVIVFVFMLPLVLFVILGPAVIVIIQAMGEIAPIAPAMK